MLVAGNSGTIESVNGPRRSILPVIVVLKTWAVRDEEGSPESVIPFTGLRALLIITTVTALLSPPNAATSTSADLLLPSTRNIPGRMNLLKWANHQNDVVRRKPSFVFQSFGVHGFSTSSKLPSPVPAPL
jgi:hypothetical protein